MNKKTWYYTEGSKIKELWTILHLPYTMMCISFVAIGFGAAGIKDWGVFLQALVAYFFGLGLAAHAFDQLPGMGSSYVKLITKNELIVLGVVSLLVSLFIAVNYAIRLGGVERTIFMILVIKQVFFVFAYPMKTLFNRRFHNDLSFASGFGSLPVIVGYYANNLYFSLEVVVLSFVAFVIAYIEITLSRYCRNIRKDTICIAFADKMLQKPEKALILLCVMTYLLAIYIVFF